MNKKKEIKELEELLKSGEVKEGSFLEFTLKYYLDALKEELKQEQMHQNNK